jgi:hypothetical protein
MPRLASRRAGRAASAALALLILAIPPGLMLGALASAAASVFEAAPLVLAGSMLPRRLRPLAPLLACGCGGRLPGALSLPALGLCWLAFGPVVTLTRVVLAVLAAVVVKRRAPGTGCPDDVDPLADLSGIALCAFAGALAVGALPGFVHGLWAPAAFLAGAAAGALAPCATAGLAAAAGLSSASPAAAAGLLASTGIASFRASPPRRPRLRGTAPALALTVAACSWLTLTGGRGFLSPAFALLAPAGAAAAAIAVRRGTRTALTMPLAIPLGLLAALVLGSPPPTEGPALLPLGLYPGRTVDFTGRLSPDGRAVGRAAMLCCRADARLLSLPLDRRLHMAPATWVRVRGRIRSGPAGLYLGDVRAAPVPPPRDPFAYL